MQSLQEPTFEWRLFLFDVLHLFLLFFWDMFWYIWNICFCAAHMLPLRPYKLWLGSWYLSPVAKSNWYCRLGDLGSLWTGQRTNCSVVPYLLVKSKMKTQSKNLKRLLQSLVYMSFLIQHDLSSKTSSYLWRVLHCITPSITAKCWDLHMRMRHNTIMSSHWLTWTYLFKSFLSCFGLGYIWGRIWFKIFSEYSNG